MNTSVARATALVALSACCFGSIAIFTTLILASGETVITALVWRYVLGGTLLAIAAGGSSALVRPGRRALPMLLIGGLGQAIVAGVSLSARHYIPAATLSFLFFTFPAWIAVMAAIRGVEALTARRMCALTLSITGVMIMVGSPWSAPMHPVGVALALGSSVFYAVYVQAIERVQRGLEPAVAGAYMSIGALVVLLIVGLPAGAVSASLAPVAWVSVLGLGVVSTLVGFLTFLRGLAILGPVRTAIIATVEPFWTAVAGAFVLAQPLTGTTLVGGGLIAGAIVVLQRQRVVIGD